MLSFHPVLNSHVNRKYIKQASKWNKKWIEIRAKHNTALRQNVHPEIPITYILTWFSSREDLLAQLDFAIANSF